MKKSYPVVIILFALFWNVVFILSSGCANIIPPGGGPKDTLPPLLLSALPKDSTLNFTGNRITLVFDEYIELQNTFENMVFSPLPKNLPVVNYNFKTVSIKIKDTLEPNTTYAISFGNSLRDINEGNVLRNFTYVYSTGNTLSTDSLTGKVVMAETGKVDSTLIVVLHRNTDDSAVAKEKPRYISKVDGQGNFTFRYLPPGRFALYAIPNDYSKLYEDSTKPFAFADSVINIGKEKSVMLYAYTFPKKELPKATSDKETKNDTAVRWQSNLQSSKLDLLGNLQFTFNKKVQTFDTNKIILTDTNLVKVRGYQVITDTGGNSLSIKYNWPPDQSYKFILLKDAVEDSAGLMLANNDTLQFSTKNVEEYGSIRIRFKNIDTSRNPVLQLVQADKIITSAPLVNGEFSRKLFPPGDYELRLLYDQNKNGVWDPGRFFGVHLQPEIVILINSKINVRANWENEKDITF